MNENPQQPFAPPRTDGDRVTALFAAALDGDQPAEITLRELALDDERAADAYMAVVGAAVAETVRAHPAGPGSVATADQITAHVRNALHLG